MSRVRHPARLDMLGHAIAVAAVLAIAAAVPAWPSIPPVDRLRITLVTVVRPDDDGTIVAGAVRGLEKADTHLAGRIATAQIRLSVPSSGIQADLNEYPSILRAVRQAARTSDAVIAWGDLFTDAVISTARQYPRVHFILQNPIPLKRFPRNVVDSTVWDGEPAFIAGAIAGLGTRTGRVGYIGPVPGWQNNAFRAGVYYARSSAHTFVDYIDTTVTAAGSPTKLLPSWRLAPGAGTSETGYHDSRKAEEIALAEFDRGADIIYASAGASDTGAYRAALARHGWIIEQGGPESLDRLPDPWRRRNLALIVSRDDLIVYELVSRMLNGPPLPPYLEWRVGNPALPVPAIGVMFGTDGRALTGPAAPKLARIMDDLRAGKIEVPYSREGLATFLRRYAR